MKKIYQSIFFSILAGVSVASCDSYEAPAITSDPAVSIVARETDFTAAASTGSIQFKADGPVTVTTSNDWLTATVEGDEIKVSCSQNNSIESRSGIITVKCGDKTTEISIIQEGVIFQIAGGVEEVKFTAGKSTKTVAIKSNVPVEVTSGSEWLTADFTDGILSVNVDDNISLDDRMGSLKILSGNIETELSVTQSGISYPIFDRTEWYPTDGRNFWNLDYPFDQDIEFSCTDPAMLTYLWDKDKQNLRIYAEKNETGHLRTGSFDYTIGPKSGSMWVHQCDFNNDLKSEDYILYYTDGSDGKVKYMPAIISWSLYKMIELPTLGLKFDINFSSTDHTITFTGGEDCGKWGSYQIFTTLGFDTETGASLTWSTSASVKALPMYEFDADDNAGYTTIEFEDAGTFTSPITEVILAAFTSTTASSGTYAGVLVDMIDPVLIRTHKVAGETPAATSVKASAKKSAIRSAKPAPAPVLTQKKVQLYK